MRSNGQGLALHASRSGNPAGDKVILLHGLFGMGSNLSMVARALAEQFDVHSLDLRNHGRSPRADNMQLSAMAGDVLAYLDAQGVEQCHIVGHSLGGKVAMQLAVMAPKRLKRLVVADIAPVSYERHHDEVFAGLNAVDLNKIQSRSDAEAVLAPHIDELGVRQFILKSLYRNSDGQFAWRMNVQVLQQHYADMREALAAGSQFDGPVLFIKGEHSSYILPEHWPQVLAHFPNASIKMIQGTGHWLHAEKPVAFNRLVLKFLQVS
jgi:esterase